MFSLQRKVKTSISVVMLACLLCAGYAAAEDKDKPQPPIKRGAEQVVSIFDENAEEFEETTYTPPTDIEEKLESLKLPENERKYLSDKYSGLITNSTFSTLKQTQYGPEGTIKLIFDIKKGWDSPNKKGETREERAKSLARAFIEEEPGLFGVFDIGELKEIKVTTDKGYGGIHTHIVYHRYINNMELMGWQLVITIGADETVGGVLGNILAPTPALYQAASKRTIGKGKIFKIIRDDLKASSEPGISVAVSKATKEAVVDPPYVIWNVEAKSYKYAKGGIFDWQWEYKIDPFTEEIIQKRKKP
ncbi:MAG: hypothetical protein Q7T53_00495 [Deltaproteobacteria bacterium]|nr:hypothetical protein [Deltaproteobacteria bacterium]